MLELPEHRAGLDPELVDERPSCLVVCGERISLPTGAVERQHQLRTQVLTERVLGDQLLELGDEIVLAPECEVSLDARLERDESQLLEPVDRRLGERLVREVLQRGAAPEPKSLAKDCGCLALPLCDEGSPPALQTAFERAQVECAVSEQHCVAAPTGHDDLRSEGLPEP
jgi:hypothetical protein